MDGGFKQIVHFKDAISVRLFIKHIFHYRAREGGLIHKFSMHWGEKESMSLKCHLDWTKGLYDLMDKIDCHDKEFCVINLHPFGVLVHRAADLLVEEIWTIEVEWFNIRYMYQEIKK